MGKISLLLAKPGENGLDITNLVQQIQWKGRKGSSSRTLVVKILDDDGYKHARAGISVEEGQQCLFLHNGVERFRGIIMKTVQSNKKIMTFTAYDNGIYLANNQDTFTYENKTADHVFKDVCTRFGLPMGEVSACSYVIPELVKAKTTGFDTIADALSLDFDATGIRHYVSSDKGKLSLLTRRENILQWVIETSQNMTAYTYTQSIEDIRTRVKMLSDEGTVLAESINSALEEKLGAFQEINTPDETLNAAQIKALCDSILAEKSTPGKTLSIDALGIPDVISGIGVFVIIPHLGLSRTFYVDEDTHTFVGNKHTMSLKLNYANDLTKPGATNAETTAGKTYKVGDVVQFNGGSHYVSSNATSPTGSPCSAGPAKITAEARGARHPWHLIHTDGQSRVYGWVDDGSFS